MSYASQYATNYKFMKNQRKIAESSKRVQAGLKAERESLRAESASREQARQQADAIQREIEEAEREFQWKRQEKNKAMFEESNPPPRQTSPVETPPPRQAPAPRQARVVGQPENCPSYGINPVPCINKKHYRDQLRLFHSDRNTGCFAESTAKFALLQNLPGCSSGSGVKKSKRKHTKKRHTKKRRFKN